MHDVAILNHKGEGYLPATTERIHYNPDMPTKHALLELATNLVSISSAHA